MAGVVPELSPLVHGFGCVAGHVLLSDEELYEINSLLANSGYRFVAPNPEILLLPEPPPTNKPTKRQQSSVAPPPAKQRKAGPSKQQQSTSNELPATTLPQAPSVFESKKKRTAEIPHVVAEIITAPPTEPVEQPYIPPPTITEPRIMETPPRSKVPYATAPNWQQAAETVLGKLENHSMAHYFVNSGINNFQTIRSKLLSNGYTHPFRWQHDIRSVFYMAFTRHPQGSPVWRSASELAVHFENLCKEEISANPYAVFKLTPKPPTPPLVVVPPPPVETPPETSPLTAESLSALAAAAAENPETITIDAAQWKALLMQFKAVESTPEVVQKSPAPPPPTVTRLAATKKNKHATILPTGVKLRDGSGVVYTPDCEKNSFAAELIRNPPVSALPPPCIVPALSEIRSQPSVSQNQKKAALARFKELDVVYRKAVLDLVKDELGIHSLLCAHDVRYIPEVDVLPPMRRGQFFAYLKVLVNQQKTAQDLHHLPATLPRVVNWGQELAIAEPQAPMESRKPQLPWSVKPIRRSASPGSSSLDSSTSAKNGHAPNRSLSSSSNASGASSCSSSISSGSSLASSNDRNSDIGGLRTNSKMPKARGAPLQTPSILGGPGAPPNLTAGLGVPGLGPSAGPGNVPGVMGSGGPPGHLAAAQGLNCPPGYGMRAPVQPRLMGTPYGMGGPPPYNHPMYGFQPGGLGKQRPRGDLIYAAPPPQQRPHQLFWRIQQPQEDWHHAHQPPSQNQPAYCPRQDSSCWGEWKVKVMQEKLVNQTRNVGVASERESRAEKADAEI